MDPKPGWKSTEFWLALGAAIIAALLASGVFGEASLMGKILAMAGSVLASLGYTAARAWTKVGAANAAALLEASKNPTQPPS